MYKRQRLIRASADGIMEPVAEIGDTVEKGQLVAWTGKQPVYAKMSGIVRGMLQKLSLIHILCDPNAAWGEVPQMLFDGNVKIAERYFPQKLGVLKEGAAADVIVVDYDPLTPMNGDNANSHILFGMTGKQVVTTVANGKVLMKDRELVSKMCIRDRIEGYWAAVRLRESERALRC